MVANLGIEIIIVFRHIVIKEPCKIGIVNHFNFLNVVNLWLNDIIIIFAGLRLNLIRI